MANTYTIRSVSSAETFNKLTVSCWFKGMADGTQRNFWGLYDNTDSNRFFGLYYSSNGSLYAYWKQDGSLQFTLGTMQKFRDPNAWHHFVMTMDTTLATASDRVKFYLNGERITVFEDSLETITQSKNITLLNGNNGRMQWGGGKISGTQYYWNGSMSHCHMCVGYAYDASAFGSTDSTTGEWKINASPSVNYGTNGGFWLKDGNQLTDSSTNSNTLTVGGGTLTKTEDCPSNNFATMATPTWYNGDISNGGNTVSSNNATSYRYQQASLGMNSGKFYWEVKLTTLGDYMLTGITGSTNYITGSTNILGSQYTEYSVVYNTVGGNGHKYNGAGASPTNTPGAFMAGFSTNDILTFALDLDSSTKKLYIGANGNWANGSGSTNQTFANASGISVIVPQNTPAGFYFPACGEYGGGTDVWNWNFGNGFFGTSAVSSNSGSGYSANGSLGIFQYQPPTGYTALCTKGLNL